MLMGNLFVFYQFQGKEHIDESTRRIVFTVLISVAIVGVVFFGLLQRVQNKHDESKRERDRDRDHELNYEPKANSAIIGAFVKAIRLFFTRNMLLLCITFLYTGNNMVQPDPFDDNILLEILFCFV